MAESARRRVSKWDMPDDKSRPPGGDPLENDKSGLQGNSQVNLQTSGTNSYGGVEGQASLFVSTQGVNAPFQVDKLDSDSVVVLPKTGPEVSKLPKTSESEMAIKEVTSWGPVCESNTEDRITDKSNSQWSAVDSGGKDNSWEAACKHEIDRKIGQAEMGNSSWDTPFNRNNHSSVSLGDDLWQQGMQSTSVKKDSRPHSSWSRSQSRSRSPALDYGGEFNRKAGSKFSSSFPREPCRAFRAGRCARGSQCVYLHDDDGMNNPNCSRGPDAADDREVRGSSNNRLSYGKRTRNDCEREEHDDYRIKRSTSQCIDYSKGRCYRGSVCRYSHHQASQDWNAEGERDKGRTNEMNTRRTSDILCKFFPEGRCRNGDKCKFSHQVQVMTPIGRPNANKWGSLGDSDNKLQWNGSAWGNTVEPNAQGNNVSGWGDDNHRAVAATSVANLFAAPSLQPQVPTVRYSTVASTANQIAYPVQGQNSAAETSAGHQWYDPSQHSLSTNMDHIQQPHKVENVPHDLNAHTETIVSSNEVNVPLSTKLGINHFPNQISGQNLQVGCQSLSAQPDQARLTQNSVLCDTRSYEAPSGSENLGSSSTSHYHTFGGQGPDISSQPSNGIHQLSVLQPIAHMHDSGTDGPTYQLSTQSGSSVEPYQENVSSQLDKGRTESSVGLTSNSKNAVTSEQMAQLTNLSASLAQIFGNRQQLPQLYAALNHNAPGATPMQPFDQSNSGVLAPSAAPAFQQNTDVWSQLHQNSSIVPVNSLSCQVQTNSVEQVMFTSPPAVSLNLPKMGSNNAVEHVQSAVSVSKLMENTVIDTGGKHSTMKLNEFAVEQGNKELLTALSQGSGADPDTSKGDKKDNDKDAKGIRMFKYTLVEFVKEILKPAWREGNMSKEVHKTIVKKVVDKVTGALQSNIPLTQERIDFYLEHSKGKLKKLVEAYIDKYAKT